MKLLIVEDSERLRKSLTTGLTQSGYTIDSTGDGREGLHYALDNDYDLIVLDLMLPSLDGLSLLQQLRDKKKDTNVLILSARDQVADRVKGLERGADDYLCKPFSFDELEARIKSIIRRSHQIKSPLVDLGPVSLDMSLRQLLVEETPLQLTPFEYAILEQLALNLGRVITYQNIEDHLYDSYQSVSRNAIEAHVSTLRKKLKNSGIMDLVKTRRGFGYYVDKP